MRRGDREINDELVIEEVIKKADVCRLAMIDHDEPYIVAMNFGYKQGSPAVFYFHCANTGRKIETIKKNNRVCFQLDLDHELVTANKACGYTMKFKSIVGYGKVYIVETNAEKIEGLHFIMKQYSDRDDFHYEDKMLNVTTVLRLEIEEISGKQKI